MLASFVHQTAGMNPRNINGEESLDVLIRDLEYFVSSNNEGQASPAESLPSTSSAMMEVEDDDPKTKLMVRNSTQGSSSKKSQAVPKADYAVDHLDLKLLHEFIQPQWVQEKNGFPSSLVTSFKKKYFRFDNKSLQCFPNCMRFADVREARMLGMDHKAGGRGDSFCTNPVEAIVMLPTLVSLESVSVVGRFLCATPDLDVLPKSDAALLAVGATVTKLPEANCNRGSAEINNPNRTDQWGRREVKLIIQPEEAWFFNMTLPRHRRNASCAAHKVPLFVFEVLVFLNQGDKYQLCSRAVSAPFEVASIRTLIREVLSFRQSSLPANMRKDLDQDEDDEDDIKPKVTAPVVSSRRQLAANYSSTVQRIRLAEASRKEEHQKKKQELVIEIVPEREVAITTNFQSMDIVEPPMLLATVTPQQSITPILGGTPLQEITFDIPDFLDMPDPMFHMSELNMAMSMPSLDDLDLGVNGDDIP